MTDKDLMAELISMREATAKILEDWDDWITVVKQLRRMKANRDMMIAKAPTHLEVDPETYDAIIERMILDQEVQGRSVSREDVEREGVKFQGVPVVLGEETRFV